MFAVVAVATVAAAFLVSHASTTAFSTLAIVPAAGRGARTMKLAEPGYVDWLKTLTGPVDYQTGSEYDNTFTSQNMPHNDLSHLLPSALPSSRIVGEMQGVNFAADVTPSIASDPVDQDEINKPHPIPRPDARVGSTPNPIDSGPLLVLEFLTLTLRP